jgi:hypothetical protein
VCRSVSTAATQVGALHVRGKAPSSSTTTVVGWVGSAAGPSLLGEEHLPRRPKRASCRCEVPPRAEDRPVHPPSTVVRREHFFHRLRVHLLSKACPTPVTVGRAYLNNSRRRNHTISATPPPRDDPPLHRTGYRPPPPGNGTRCRRPCLHFLALYPTPTPRTSKPTRASTGGSSGVADLSDWRSDKFPSALAAVRESMLGPRPAAHHIELRACLATRTDVSAVSAVSGRPAVRTTGPTNHVINSSTRKDPTSLADPTIVYRHLKAGILQESPHAVEPHQILRVSSPTVSGGVQSVADHVRPRGRGGS